MSSRARIPFRSLLRAAAVAVLAVAAAGALYHWIGEPSAEREAERLIRQLEIAPGMTVAEIGAGSGATAAHVARFLGPSGRLYVTEVDSARLETLRQLAAQAETANITVIEASEDRTGLPEGACDAVYMVKVYHHFTHPAQINASLYRALRPGGRLAISDFPPRWWTFWAPPVDGVPANRGGHGMPLELLIEEVRAAGFALDSWQEDWGGFPRRYLIVFRKPGLRRQPGPPQ